METSPGMTTGYAGDREKDTSLAQQAKEQGRQVVEKTQEMAGQVMDQAQEQVKSQLASQKERATDGLGRAAEAFRHTGEEFRAQELGFLSEYTDWVAHMVENCSSYLRERDVNEIIRDVQNYGRRQPAMFLGGAFALGFLATRFLRSSSERAYRSEDWGARRSDYDALSSRNLPAAYEPAPSVTATPYAAGVGGQDLTYRPGASPGDMTYRPGADVAATAYASDLDEEEEEVARPAGSFSE